MTGPQSHHFGARASRLRRATSSLFASLLAACGASGTSPAPPQVQAEPQPARGGAQLVDPRPLQGAGAVAFHPARSSLAWAAGEDVRIQELDAEAGAGERRIAVGDRVADLGFAPDGALWLIADVPQLWRDGAPVCRAEGLEADRLLAVDAHGAVVAAYSHSDGVGMLRRQVWIDTQCNVADEQVERLSERAADAGSDPGAPLGRATLRAQRPDAAALARLLSTMRLPAGAGVERAVLVSADRRWWVLDGAQGRTLWRRGP